MAKDLILTYATDVGLDDLRRLIMSARRYCSREDVDIVVIINPLGQRFHALAQQYDVELMPCTSVWKEIRPSKPMKIFYRLLLKLVEKFERYPSVFGDRSITSYVHRTIAYPWLHAIVQRHLAYESLLKVRSNYRMIFLSDARDVILQANPFPLLDETKLHVFLHEADNVYLSAQALKAGRHHVDSMWVRDVVGEDTLDRLQGLPVICCGTTIGGYDAMMSYLSLMTGQILQRKFKPVDQAISNAILRLEYPASKLVLHENREGIVLTLDGMRSEQLEFVDGEICFGGRPMPVVHMYDRLTETAEFVAELYPGSE